MAELLAYLARELVDDPDSVRVETEERDGAVVLLLHVAPDDVGKVIGRGGRIVRALRTVVPRERRPGRPSRPDRDRGVTRVAALYDVHGMSWALAAVLDEAAAEDVDVVLFGGDLVTAPDPTATIELARASGGVFVRGNCDREPDAWVTEQLAPADLRWLAELPQTAALDDVLYCHSTPTDDQILLTAATPELELRAAFGAIAEPTVVIGHTHHQFDRRLADLRVVNAGSVGMAYEDTVAAFWALVVDGEPLLRRTVFDVEAAVQSAPATGWPEAAEFVAENLLGVPSRAEAIDHFERQRVAS